MSSQRSLVDVSYARVFTTVSAKRLLRGEVLAVSELRVGGSVRLKGPVELDVVDVAGSLTVESDLRVHDELRVSGSARIRGRLRAGSVAVSGSMSVDGDVEAHDIVVNGSFKASSLRGDSVTVNGSISIGRLEAREVEVNGSIRGEVRAVRVRLGRKSKARGKIVAHTVIVERDAEAETVIAHEAIVGRDAHIDYLEARRARIRRGAEVEMLRYIESYETEEDAEIGVAEKVDSLSEEPPEG